MAGKKEEVTARWLEKDGKVELQADSAKALSEGWAEPKQLRSNGAPWNPEPIDGVTPQAEFVARLHESNAEVEGERAAKKAKDEEAARVEVEPVPPTPDLRVSIVEEPNGSATAARVSVPHTASPVSKAAPAKKVAAKSKRR